MAQSNIPADDVMTARAQVPDHVVFRTFAAETVVLNLETGKYHGLNPIGGRMLEVLSESPSVAAAAAVLAREYGEPIARIQADLHEFCSELAQRGLLQLRVAAAA